MKSYTVYFDDDQYHIIEVDEVIFLDLFNLILFYRNWGSSFVKYFDYDYHHKLLVNGDCEKFYDISSVLIQNCVTYELTDTLIKCLYDSNVMN